VEEALHAHPGVAEAAVVGVPDAYRGEALVAYVVCRDGNVSVDALQQHLAQRLLRYKWPAQLHLVPVLPRTAVGKLDKVRLRQQAQQAPQG
jgi:long-chain acyl-CoA synthetase